VSGRPLACKSSEIPEEQAIALAEVEGSDDEPFGVRVCQECAAKSPFGRAHPADEPMPVSRPT